MNLQDAHRLQRDNHWVELCNSFDWYDESDNVRIIIITSQRRIKLREIEIPSKWEFIFHFASVLSCMCGNSNTYYDYGWSDWISTSTIFSPCCCCKSLWPFVTLECSVCWRQCLMLMVIVMLASLAPHESVHIYISLFPRNDSQLLTLLYIERYIVSKEVVIALVDNVPEHTLFFL